MKVLVTGSSGRVGRAIYVRLALKHEVVGLDRSPSSTAHFVGDISDIDLLRQAVRGTDAIVHTAALHAPQVGLLPDSEFARINVEATRALAELAVESGVKHFVFTSTTALYGSASTPASKAGWVDELLEPEPRTIYHTSKIEAENVLADLASRSRLAVTALRMSRCFPEPAPVMASYRLHRAIDARDVADAHACALHSGEPGLRTFVISGTTPFFPEDTEELLSDAPAVLKRRAPGLVEAFRRRGWALPESIDRVYSPARAMEKLSWMPRFGYSEVLKMLNEQSSEVLPP